MSNHNSTTPRPYNKDGRCSTRAFSSWRSMLQRCYKRSFKHYRNYGGRGIEVCERWRLSFLAFLADMGERPIGMTLERVDNNLGYTLDNCRWATRKQQSRNMRTNHLLSYDGQTRCMTEWAEIVGLPYTTLRGRMRLGWPVSRALTEPVHKQSSSL